MFNPIHTTLQISDRSPPPLTTPSTPQPPGKNIQLVLQSPHRGLETIINTKHRTKPREVTLLTTGVHNTGSYLGSMAPYTPLFQPRGGNPASRSFSSSSRLRQGYTSPRGSFIGQTWTKIIS